MWHSQPNTCSLDQCRVPMCGVLLAHSFYFCRKILEPLHLKMLGVQTKGWNVWCLQRQVTSVNSIDSSYIEKTSIVLIDECRYSACKCSWFRIYIYARALWKFLFMLSLWCNLHLHVGRYWSMYIGKSKKYQGDYHGEAVYLHIWILSRPYLVDIYTALAWALITYTLASKWPSANHAV